jgi:transposase
MRRKKKTDAKTRTEPGNVSRSGKRSIVSYKLGALPILDAVIRRARIEDHLGNYLREDQRCVVPPSRTAVVLLKNYLASRQPIYGVAHWARQHAPEQLGLSKKQVASLNDDRFGRCLDRVFEADSRSLVLAIVRHVIKEFDVSLDELHNDSTTLTFSGEYDAAADRLQPFGKATRIITWGHNKDHRPDLKQLLYTLTVTEDGAVPVNFAVGDGNLTDDQTHRETWDLVRELAGRSDFLYVADSKLATTQNMAYIDSQGGRFVTTLPRTRAEDKEFRARLVNGEVTWGPLCVRTDDDGAITDEVSIIQGETLTKDGYRLLWFHSQSKAEMDARVRSEKILRALRSIEDLQKKMHSPRTRYTSEEKVAKAVSKALSGHGASDWIAVSIVPREEERFKQTRPGRPGKDVSYRKEVKTRFALEYDVEHIAVALSGVQDGVFPLITNDLSLTALEVFDAYKRQASIEKRFSQLKTDYQLAPAFLKAAHRLEGMMFIYFLALLVQALVERELRQGMQQEGIEHLAFYPEDRPCRAPTTSKLIELFENVARHDLSGSGGQAEGFVPELTREQKRVLRLLDIPLAEYECGP